MPALDVGVKKMSEAPVGIHDSATPDAETANTAAKTAADFLTLAAAPTFAIMALLTPVLGGGSADAFCSSASPLSGMVPMYLLMSAFHSAPWLKLILGRKRMICAHKKNCYRHGQFG